MDVTELAWAAGLFEGEGSVRINPRTKRNNGALVVDVPNVDPEIPAFFLARWGGSVSVSNPPNNRRTVYRWRAASRMAARFLRDILPYLQTAKYRNRALLGLEYQAQKTRGGPRRSFAYTAGQREYFERMAVLNRRGLSAQTTPPPEPRVRIDMQLGLFAPNANQHGRAS